MFRLPNALTRRATLAGICLLGAAGAMVSCYARDGAEGKGGSAMSLKLTTTAFSPGGAIPKKFTCDGPDVSPALAWTDPPADTQSFALIMDDPDAPVGTWVHWVLYDLPADTRDLPEGVPREEGLSGGARQGRNDFRKIG